MIGFGIAAGIGWIIVKATADTALPVVMTPALIVGLFVLTVVMCVALGDRRHRAGDAHRSRDGLHAMTAPVIEAIDVVKFLGDGAGQVQALKGVEPDRSPAAN